MRRTIGFLALLIAFGLSSAVPPAPAQKAQQPPANDRYEFRQIRVGKQFEVIRFKVKTGESWRIAGDKFEKLAETGPVPAGDYEVSLIAVEDDWMAFRIDRVSGTTWMLRQRQWIRLKEPGEEKGA